MQRLELCRHGGEAVDRAASGAALRHGALNQVLRARAPILELDAVFLLEGGDHRVHVGRHGGTVDADGAFLLGAFDQHLGAVGALIGGDLGQGSVCA